MIGPKLEGIQAGKPVRVLPTYKAAKYFRQHSRKTTPNDAVLSPLVAGGTVACCLQLNALLLRQVASFAALRIMILKQTKLNCFCVLKCNTFSLSIDASCKSSFKLCLLSVKSILLPPLCPGTLRSSWNYPRSSYYIPSLKKIVLSQATNQDKYAGIS